MKLAVWKYGLPAIGKLEIEMPKGARVLTAQVQDNKPMLWAVVNPEKKEMEKRTFECVTTGSEIKRGERTYMGYISTLQLHSRPLVIHVFEHIEIPPYVMGDDLKAIHEEFEK
jgi:hypothetical protein